MSQTKSTTSQKKPAASQKKPDVSKQKPATKQKNPAVNQKKPAVNQKKPVSNTQKPAPKAKKAPKTQAFDVTNKKKKAQKSPRERKRIVIAIFLVIILVLSVFAVLLIGNILNKYKDIQNQPEQNLNVTYVEKSADDIKVGNLLYIDSEFTYNFPSNLSSMINLYQYQRNSANANATQINGCNTYALTYDRIHLNSTTLDALNAMMMAYCQTLDLTNVNANSASNIEIAWGGYTNSTLGEYAGDVNLGKGFYDHALGTTFTIKQNAPSTVITESLLKSSYTWIYENAHKYGFIIRYPGDCKNHTGEDSSKRVHFRYVGVEHATYIYENNICLDEYLELLREIHGFNNPLTFTAGDKEYQVYYVKYSGNPTQIPVLKDSNYSISGDNMNGFIVTVEK